MNKSRRLTQRMEDSIFDIQSPLLEGFIEPKLEFGSEIDRDPRRATVCRKVRETIDAFLREKHYTLSTGYFIIDKELFIEHINDTIHISIKDTPANLAVTGASIAASAPPGTSVVINTATNTAATLEFFKNHRSELEKRLNEKCKGFTVVVEHDFVNYLTITLKEKRLAFPTVRY